MGLRYEVEQPFAEPHAFEEGQRVWIHVSDGPTAWERVGVTDTQGPSSTHLRSLRAVWRQGRPDLTGAGRLHLNEEARREVLLLLREQRDEWLVDLAVDDAGHVSPLRLRIAGQRFGAP